MILINQHTTSRSLKKHLKPNSIKLDGRNQSDYLRFLSDFSTLINFYNQNNELKNDWSPFLLKDPFILLSTISNFPIIELKARYEDELKSLQKFKTGTNHTKSIEIYSSQDIEIISEGVKVLLTQLLNFFQQLQLWTHYLDHNHKNFPLKKYLIKRIRNQFGPLLWDILSFKEQLIVSSTLHIKQEKIENIFKGFNPKVWNVGIPPEFSWQKQGFSKPLDSETLDLIYHYLKQVGEDVLLFMGVLKQEAKLEIERLELKTAYPDTVLLRCFVELLYSQLQPFNSISKKHLDFYYSRVLKQKKQDAIMDRVFASVKLGKSFNQFELDGGKLFNAGMYPNKETILFENLNNTQLNQAEIIKAYTLSKKNLDNNSFEIFLNQRELPSQILYKPEGEIESWAAFGEATATSSQVKMGIALGSPMLYLEEGKRVITINLSFANKVPLNLIQNTSTFLSTNNSWLKLEKHKDSPSKIEYSVPATRIKYDDQIIANDDKDCVSEVTLKITLQPEIPPIVPFSENPDGYYCPWPLICFRFSEYGSNCNLPVLKIVEFTVDVCGLVDLELANDTGSLSSKKPYQLFGPSPFIKSNFFIGSSEIFSKPLSQLNFTLDWSTLPESLQFSDYYSQYNDYLTEFPTQDEPNPKQAKKISLVQKFKLFFEKEFSLAESNRKRSIALIKKTFSKWYFLPLKFSILPLFEISSALMLGLATFLAKFFLLALTILSSIVNPLIKIAQWLNRELFQFSEPKPEQIVIPYFNNLCFKIQISSLQNQFWKKNSFFQSYYDKISKCYKKFQTPESCKSYEDDDSKEPGISLYKTNGKDCTLAKTNSFSWDNISSLDFDPDASLQVSKLKFTDQTKNGFVKMQLTGPAFGFGRDLYQKVVADLTLKNGIAAVQLSKKPVPSPKPVILPPANVPFSPELKRLTASYSAKIQYDLSKNTEPYPLECFSYSPFQVFKSYDNSSDPGKRVYHDKFSLVGTTKNDKVKTGKPIGIPMYLPFCPNGSALLEISSLSQDDQLNLYFELTKNYLHTESESNKITWNILTNKGWRNLEVISDQTRNLICSGIVGLQVNPAFSTQTSFMPTGFSWISVNLNGNVASSSHVITVQNNGVELIRRSNSSIDYRSNPVLKANKITGPAESLPEVQVVKQFFPSFGGLASETKSKRNYRVANRIFSKDRLVSNSDFYEAIKMQFQEIYFTKLYFDTTLQQTNLILIRQYNGLSNPSCFLPFPNTCTVEKIMDFAKKKSAASLQLNFINFTPLYVAVTGTIIVNSVTSCSGFFNRINEALNLYLSPWIKANQVQVIIDRGISAIEVSNFLSSFSEVVELENIKLIKPGHSLSKGIKYKNSRQKKYNRIETRTENELLVSALNHPLKVKSQKA